MEMEQFTIEIEYSHFTTDGENFKEGDRFISVDIESKAKEIQELFDKHIIKKE